MFDPFFPYETPIYMEKISKTKSVFCSTQPVKATENYINFSHHIKAKFDDVSVNLLNIM
jgi:hypothetical protein